MIIKLNLFFKELSLFGSALVLGVFSAYNNVSLIEKSVVRPVAFSWNEIVIFLIFIGVMALMLIKFQKAAGFSLRFFLLLVIFSGSQIVFRSVMPSPWDLFLALALAAVYLRVKNILIHNLAILLGIAGISSLLGLSITPFVGVILLVVLSFYDILAVYGTKHMVYLAKGMVASGAIFGFIIPFDLRDLFYHKHSARAREQIGEKFMILGSGDIGLPIILASSLAVVSLQQAFITSTFAVGGLFLTHLLFVNQKERKPMAALPPIAMMTIIGYLIAVV